jgi:hypothetical protein
MKRGLVIFLCIFLAFPFAFVGNSYAGDRMPAGTVLENDSYVFTIEEAEALKARIIELEKQSEELDLKVLELERYKELEVVRTQQIDLYKLSEEFYKTQISDYKDLHLLDQGLLDKYRKRDRLQTIENIGFLSLGVALTIGSFLLADAATDVAIITTP